MRMANFSPQSVSICRGDSARIIMTNHIIITEVVRIHRHIRVSLLTFRRTRMNFIFNLNLAVEIQNTYHKRFVNRYYVGIYVCVFTYFYYWILKQRCGRTIFVPNLFLSALDPFGYLYVYALAKQQPFRLEQPNIYLYVDAKYNVEFALM